MKLNNKEKKLAKIARVAIVRVQEASTVDKLRVAMHELELVMRAAEKLVDYQMEDFGEVKNDLFYIGLYKALQKTKQQYQGRSLLSAA